MFGEWFDRIIERSQEETNQNTVILPDWMEAYFNGARRILGTNVVYAPPFVGRIKKDKHHGYQYRKYAMHKHKQDIVFDGLRDMLMS